MAAALGAPRGTGLRLVLLGAPGAGKGTQAARIRERFGLPHISTGDMLRTAMAEGTPLGERVRAIVERGELVPDDVIGAIMSERLAREDAAGGFLLDGFPRTVAQADRLDAILAGRGQALDRVISIEVPEDELVERLAGRRTCGVCGATYHVKHDPPRAAGVCDACGGPLRQRADDAPAAVSERLRVHQAQTAPLVARYRRQGLLQAVEGTGRPEEVFARIVAGLEGPAEARA